MPGFSQRERTRIAAALVEVERCLTEATHALDAAAARFSSVPDDATPLQRRLIADYAERFREAMAALADRYRVQIEPAGRSARQRARDALDRAMVVVEELGPRRFLTDGEPSDELASELRRIVSQLQEPLDAMRAVLTGAAIVPAPAVSSAASGDGALLADIARVIAAHELGELAPALQCLAGRFKQNDLEIAAFGRVNSGKSSLLNAFLGEPLLPVGLTPVTAIDIHVVHGKEAWGFATFADAIDEKFAPGRLPEFAAERYNARNVRHVTRLRVEVPSPALAGGVSVVDTPGLAFNGPAAPLDALSCDIGLVLLDAAAGLGLDEAAVVSALHRAGSIPVVVITKADRLPDSERWAIHGLIERGLGAMTGLSVEAYFASTAADDLALRSDWLDRGLRPLLDRRVEIRAGSLHRKLERLRDRTIDALERRLACARHAERSYRARRDADRAVSDARAALDGIGAASRGLDPRRRDHEGRPVTGQ